MCASSRPRATARRSTCSIPTPRRTRSARRREHYDLGTEPPPCARFHVVASFPLEIEMFMRTSFVTAMLLAAMSLPAAAKDVNNIGGLTQSEFHGLTQDLGAAL